MSNLMTLGSYGLLPTGRLFDDVDTIFDTFFGDRRGLTRALSYTPRVNIEEGPTGYSIHMAAPGLSRDDFKIHADGGYLTISVDQGTESEEKAKWVSREYSYTSFTRSWKLPTTVDAASIGARYEAGILTVHIPNSNKKSSKVEIKVD